MKSLQLPVGIFFALAASLAAQTAPRSISVTASRAYPQQPDQIVVAVALSTPLSTNLDDALAALANSGITAADLSSVRTSDITNPGGSPNCVPGLQWIFTLGVPFTKSKDTATLLTSIRKNVAQNLPGLELQFAVQGVRLSAQLQASQQCPITDLLADARAQAQKLADAAGASVGPIQALSDHSTSPVLPVAYSIAPIFSFVPVNSCSGTASGSSGTSFAPLPSCAIEVRFTLLPSQ